jgi:hypothetical protein
VPLDPGDILRRAWASVEASGVPESLYETALKEAVAILRDEGKPSGAGGTGPSQDRGGSEPAKPSKMTGRRASSSRKSAPKQATAGESSVVVPDENTFFERLAHESGVEDGKLRDILQFKADGTVAVTPPTRTLGSSKAVQARTVVALVAPARMFGLGEKPVNAEKVRAECQRKNCFDSANFGAAVVGKLNGVNYGTSKSELVVTAKWVGEFQTAVAVASGEAADAEE